MDETTPLVASVGLASQRSFAPRSGCRHAIIYSTVCGAFAVLTYCGVLLVANARLCKSGAPSLVVIHAACELIFIALYLWLFLAMNCRFSVLTECVTTAIFAPDLSRVETGKEPRNCNSIGEALTIGVSILFVFSLPAFGWVVLALRHCDERSVVVYLSVGCSIAHALLVFVPSIWHCATLQAGWSSRELAERPASFSGMVARASAAVAGSSVGPQGWQQQGGGHRLGGEL